MTPESSLRAIRKVRLATTLCVAVIIVIMGYYVSNNPDLSDSTLSLMFWVAVILLISSVAIPIGFTIWVAKKGPSIPEDEPPKSGSGQEQ